MTEMERKFLVKNKTFKKEASTRSRITQGFLNTDPERTVRVRLKSKKGFITVKGKSDEKGISRFEWEHQITAKEALELLHLCEEGIIDKTRYEVPRGDHIFEVDEFHGNNEGLFIAEIELNDPKEIFEVPPWLGAEVTGEIKYYNSQLSKHPYTTWK